MLCHTLGMFKTFVLSSDTTFAPHVVFDGYWESWITAAMCGIIRRGMHVVEIGANVGYYTMLFAHLVGENGHVDAFEPNPQLVPLLMDNLRLNGLSAVTDVHECAVSDVCGSHDLRCPPRSPMEGSIVCGADDWMSLDVKVANLDFALSSVPDVIFCGACGAEPEVVSGASGILSTEKPPIFVCSWRPHYAKRFGVEMMEGGYDAWEISSSGVACPVSVEKLQRLGCATTVFKKRSVA
ncbi:MAG: FkbM family methyltransferase [bacterium]